MTVPTRVGGFKPVTDYARARRDANGLVIRVDNRLNSHGNYFDVLLKKCLTG